MSRSIVDVMTRQDKMENELKVSMEDDNTTQQGTLADSKTMDNEELIADEHHERDVLFDISNYRIQFALPDYNIPRTEYGIVD